MSTLDIAQLRAVAEKMSPGPHRNGYDAQREYRNAEYRREFTRETILALLDRIEELDRSAVPPYTQCEMCSETDCCEGEWHDGSEFHCLHCTRLGELTSYDHKSGHTFWVLHSLEEE